MEHGVIADDPDALRLDARANAPGERLRMVRLLLDSLGDYAVSLAGAAGH